MPPLTAELLAEWDDAFGKGAKATIDEYVELVRRHPAMPHDTGHLAEGVEVTQRNVRSGGSIEYTVTSTARSADGADYGTILDRSRGQKIVPRNKKALANVATGWGPFASAHLTTAHVGWWDKVNSRQVWEQAIRNLSRFFR